MPGMGGQYHRNIQYIRGELTTAKIDELWIEFLLQPEYYEWFEVELMIVRFNSYT